MRAIQGGRESHRETVNKGETMKSTLLNSIWAVSLLAAVAMPIRLLAQEQSATQGQKPEPTRYIVTDLGTLEGGTFSQPFFINRYGLVSGSSSLPDGNQHAVLWLGHLKLDIGAPGLGGPNSIAFGDNDGFQSAGEAETSTPDPNGEDFCGFGTHLTCLPFMWQDGRMIQLPTLGGNNGTATAISNRGEVAGFAEDPTPDPGCPAPQVLHFEPVVWEKGVIHKLPTVGGDPDGITYLINDNGQVVGGSGTCGTFNPNSLNNLLPVHALLWENGHATDLGNLGGQTGQAGGNIAFAINNQGQVVGNSDLPGDTTFHAFLWTKKTGMQDLGALPGDVASLSISINDAGTVIGASLDPNFNPRAFLWEKGVMTDLNTLIVSDSPLYLLTGCSINSRGEITGLGMTSTGEIHTYLAIPTHDSATSESTSRGVISPRILSDDARKLLQQQLRFGQSGVRFMGLQQ
jgi:probable HAF family extracellular repeat protein